MCVLAHVFEAHGIATVTLASVRPVAEAMHPPRALYCEFPLGRPLGKVGDPAFQTSVLDAAFGLLDAPSGPVLADFPEVIELGTEPLACSLPPRFDPDLPPAVDEVRGLRAAWERSRDSRGRTSVGRVLPGERIDEVAAAFAAVAAGTPWKEAGFPDNPVGCAHDLRDYYEEAALALADAPDAAVPGAIETWYYEVTEAGRTVLAARKAMQDQGAPFPLWFYLAPGTR